MEQPKSQNTSKPVRLLRLKQVEELTGLKKTSIYQGMQKNPPTFPRCVRLATKAVAWRETDIAEWQSKLQCAKP